MVVAVTFDQPVDHRIIGSGWSTWSHGYAGDVYFAQNVTTLTISLPPGTLAFSFFAESNAFGDFEDRGDRELGDDLGAVAVNGNGGATYFGFLPDLGGRAAHQHHGDVYGCVRLRGR